MTGETITTGTRSRIHHSDALNSGALQGNNPQSPNSVFTVEPQSEVSPAPEAATVQNLTINGVSVADIRKKIEDGGTNISFKNIQNKNDAELYEYITDYINGELKYYFLEEKCIKGLSEEQIEDIFNNHMVKYWVHSLNYDEAINMVINNAELEVSEQQESAEINGYRDAILNNKLSLIRFIREYSYRGSLQTL